LPRLRLANAIASCKLSYGRSQQRLSLLRSHFALVSSRDIYLSLAILERRQVSRVENAGSLSPYELRCFSQNGEDGVVAEIMSRVGSEQRFFVEFGIQDGREGNCVLLADVADWSGLFIEADRSDYERLEAKYIAAPHVKTVNALVTPENVEEVFDRASVPEEFDLLSIDIDGQDYWVWEALNSYRPRVVVIEYNSGLPASRRLVQPRGNPQLWDGSDYIGASLAALEVLAHQKGYALVHTDLTGLNAFFVRADLTSGRFPAPERVPRRVFPNYHLQGVRHLPDPRRRSYVDLDS
jgi:hypothetical protein